MVIHFICRGNSLRSIIAEAYLKSLRLENVEVHSSGTIAADNWVDNIPNFHDTLRLLERHGIAQYAKKVHGEQLPAGKPVTGDVVVLFNEVVRKEAEQIAELPDAVRIWNVADVGEPGRIPENKAAANRFREEIYQEITQRVDQLVSELHLQPKKV